MRKSILLLALILPFVSWAQNPHCDFKYALKVGNVMSRDWQQVAIYAADGSPVHTFAGKKIDWIQIAPTFVIQTPKGNFQEIGLLQSKFSKEETLVDDTLNLGFRSGERQRVELALKYGYYYRFLKKKQAAFAPMIGLDAVPFFNLDRNTPPTGLGTPVTYKSYGLGVFLTPRIGWYPNSCIFADASLSINLLQIANYHSFIPYPNTIPQYQTTDNFALVGFNGQVRAQVNVGVKL
jgi:hypothetical protein